MTASHAIRFGPLPPYLRLELASQRAQIEALYGSRRRWVRRFKQQLELEQIEYESMFLAPLRMARERGVPTPTLDLLVTLAALKFKASMSPSDLNAQ